MRDRARFPGKNFFPKTNGEMGQEKGFLNLMKNLVIGFQ